MRFMAYALLLLNVSFLAGCHTVAGTATGMATGMRQDIETVTGPKHKSTTTTTTHHTTSKANVRNPNTVISY